MFVLTLAGCLALFLIQFVLYKRDNPQKKLFFFKSSDLLDICKELLIIFLGATIALNVTSYVEERESRNHVVKLLEIAQNDVRTQYSFNTYFLNEYNQQKMSIDMVRANVRERYGIINNILENDTVITTISPLVYSMLISELRNLDEVLALFRNKELDDEDYVLALATANSTCQGIIIVLDIEINRLKNEYSDSKAEELIDDYLNKRFVSIEQ